MTRLLFVAVVFLLTACSLSTTRSDPQIVYITATPESGGFAEPIISTDSPPVVIEPTSPPPTPTDPPSVIVIESPPALAFLPTANPPRFELARTVETAHTVRTGDTLFGIAAAYGVSLDALLAVNELIDPNLLSVGQVIQLPDLPTEITPDYKIIPDARLVRGPGSTGFDVAAFIAEQPGYIRTVTDEVDTRQADGSILTETLNAAQIIERVSLEYSVDARILLAVLEFTAGWLSNPQPPASRRERPFDVDRDGFYRYMTWAANQLNMGYYGWRYRGWTTLEFSGTERYLYSPDLNAGTVAVQYFLSTQMNRSGWLRAVSSGGFQALYMFYFGDPFDGVLDPVVPPDLTQPPMTLPFGAGETWYFTGGAHGGWASGSAWSAIDFAPPDDPPPGVACYTSDYWVRAVAPGIIARSEGGVVVLDLDFDGDESTGWTVLYLHLADDDRIAEGAIVEAGDPIGRASCAGGFSTATHLHIGRRYNGEWIPADCFVCAESEPRPAFNLGGWRVIGIRNQEYQGFLERGAERRTAQQGRLSLVNQISW